MSFVEHSEGFAKFRILCSASSCFRQKEKQLFVALFLGGQFLFLSVFTQLFPIYLTRKRELNRQMKRM